MAGIMQDWPQRLSSVPIGDKNWQENDKIQESIGKGGIQIRVMGRVFCPGFRYRTGYQDNAGRQG